jgi:Domain of Unknown Function (DUF928)
MTVTSLTLAAGLWIASLSLANPLLANQSAPSSTVNPLPTNSIQLLAADKPPPPSGGNTSRGGQRSGCTIASSTANKNVYALVPNNQIAQTMSTNPALWFYLPYNAKATPLTVRLSVQSETKGIPAYSKLISLSGTPGLVGVRLPQSLKPGVTYHWYFTVVCDANMDGASVEGRVKVATSAAGINQKSLAIAQQINAYKQANIWHDRVTLLATQRGKNPQTEMEWQALLKELGMENLAQEPVLGIFKVQ